MERENLSKIFGRFAGREVGLIEKPYEIKLRSTGETIRGTNLVLGNENDPTVKELREEASKHGLQLRLWWPGLMGTMDYRLDRLNAHVEKADDGKWRVSSNFGIG